MRPSRSVTAPSRTRRSGEPNGVLDKNGTVPSVVPSSDTEALKRILSASRRPGDEAQWTRIIAAVAAAEAGFAPQVARLLAAAAPYQPANTVLLVPAELTCTCEQGVSSLDGTGLGRVDLVFKNAAKSFYLLVENKLASGYGDRQLERYRDAVEANAAAHKGLVAITTATPLKGEEIVYGDPVWLGSLRWWQLFDGLRDIDFENSVVGALWRTYLDLLREQGDFGPMDATADLVHGWAQRDDAERLLFALLTELVEPTCAAIIDAGYPQGASLKYAGKGESVAVVKHRNRPHLKFRVPADGTEERLWVQFYAHKGTARFGVQARYQHPHESLADDERVSRSTTVLQQELGFTCGTDGSGHHWSKFVPVDKVIVGPETHDRLVDLVRTVVHDLVASGLFEALDARTPTSAPVEVGEDDQGA